MTDIEKINILLDKLTLDALGLIEEEVQTKLNMENAMCDGETHLAKSRYILGQNNVSSLQLPTENSPEFDAGIRVFEDKIEELPTGKARHLEVVKKEERIDPVKWFGYLVPQDLIHAQSRYKQALHWMTVACNLQSWLVEVCTKIKQLKQYKQELIANVD